MSLGGNLVLHLIGQRPAHAAILGAPAPMSFLGTSTGPSRPGEEPEDRARRMAANVEQARKNIESIRCPILVLVGTDDGLLPVDRMLHDRLEKGGKSVRLEIYEKGYHDFCLGPQGHAGRKEPLLDVTLDALEESVKFLREPADLGRSAQDIRHQGDRRLRRGPGPRPRIPWPVAGDRAGWQDRTRQRLRQALDRERAPVVPDTMFGVGSVTKQFACACILLLAEDGKLSVDDRVAKYYPASTAPIGSRSMT